jgi:hypothetical protein
LRLSEVDETQKVIAKSLPPTGACMGLLRRSLGASHGVRAASSSQPACQVDGMHSSPCIYKRNLDFMRVLLLPYRMFET